LKLILSRKGFDSSAGGCPSPLFPDGRGYALPIPDRRSRIPYGDIQWRGQSVGTLIRNLTGDPRARQRKAHLDPDLIVDSLPRKQGWRPCLGQSGSAQGHLKKQGVGEGDLFLFFGLFQAVEKQQGRWRFRRDSKPFHGLWGWLQIGEVHAIDQLSDGQLPWAGYHPHFHGEADSANTLYVASEQLELAGQEVGCNGAGTFDQMTFKHRLTAPQARTTTEWQLPACFYPESAADAMTYHQNMDRWARNEPGCSLKSAARGQEFVLDAAHKPEVLNWVKTLLQGADQ
jgi:putative DNA base modification enzyme with NMAD domain